MGDADKSKQGIIEEIVHDVEHCYGNKLNTLQQAKRIHKSITMDDVHKLMHQVSFEHKRGDSN